MKTAVARVLICSWMVAGLVPATAELSMAQQEPELIVIAETRDGPMRLTRENIVGEWTGLVPEWNTLITLRFREDGTAMLVIADERAQSVVVNVHQVQEFELEPWRFVVRAADVIVEAKGAVNHAEGQVIVQEGSRSQSSQVYFFRAYEGSWMRRMEELRRLVPSTEPREAEPV